MQYAEPNELPYRFREIEHCEIPGTDGTQLAAKLWVPEGAEAAPKPAILEFIPYRKRDFKAGRDAANHRYFAGHGYACVRVDMRGSGDSEGVLRDEYLEEEQEDGLAILRWIAAQPWCDGQVGMFGISWGGFNGLQIAARQPSELKAVISVASTDDRYADDVHYMGGCLLGDNLSWATVMFGYNASPPDPALVGDRFLPLWLERLEHSGLWVKNWLQHQTRDAYWKNGSICEAYERVQTPVMAVSGWADGYSNAVFRMAEHLRAPFKGLVGAWGHRYPHFGVPGPAIGFLQECLRWWDYWLKGKPTGVEAEPRLRLFLQHSMSPATAYAERSGHWIAEDTWPSPRITPRRYRMDALGRLETTPAGPSKGDGKRHRWTIQSPLSVGMFSGKWCSFAAAPDLPGDQREEDGGSLVWQTDRLSEPLDVVGAPIVTLSLSANQPQAMVAVRLSDVFPNGKAARVCYGILNLCHRRSHEFPEPLEPGEWFTVQVKLNDCAHRFAQGHQIRLAVSTTLWPLAWPPPCPAALTIHGQASHLELPTRPTTGENAEVAFDEPVAARGLPMQTLRPPDAKWQVFRDLGSEASALEVLKDHGETLREDIDLAFSNRVKESYRFQGDDFLSARGETEIHREWSREGWHCEIKGRTRMTCDEAKFYIYAELDAFLNRERMFSKTWKESIPRNFQ